MGWVIPNGAEKGRERRKTENINCGGIIMKKLFSFYEITEKAQQRAIEDYRKVLLDVTKVSDFENEEDYHKIITEIETCDDFVKACLLINEYSFYKDGKIANLKE
jgi:hypothetical protein